MNKQQLLDQLKNLMKSSPDINYDQAIEDCENLVKQLTHIEDPTRVWLVCKKEGKASAYRMHKQDVEGYVNVLRDKGFREFEITASLYEINDNGRFELSGE